MSDRTLRGKAAVVGIGQTTYYKHGGSPDSEFKLALMAMVNACKDAGISPHEVDGFASYGNDRSDAPRPGLRTRLQGVPLLQHVLGRRRRRRVRRGGECRRGGGHRHGGLRGGVPLAGAGAVRTLRPRHRRTAGRRRRPVPVPLRHDVAGAAFRHEGDALHARARHPAGSAAGDLPRLLPPRAEQPQRGDARPAAGRGEIRQLPLDHRAVLPPVRLLPGERRRRRGDRGVRRPRQGLSQQAGLHAGRGAGLRPSQRRAGAQHARLSQLAFPRAGAASLQHGEARPRGHAGGAVLRELHRRRADEPGGARPGQAGRSQRVPGAGEPARPGRRACR